MIAGGAVAVTASSTGSIDATAFGASLTIASSSDGTAAGLSANVAVTTNTINNTTRAAIEDSAVAHAILECVGLPPRAPPIAAARAEPGAVSPDLGDAFDFDQTPASEED